MSNYNYNKSEELLKKLLQELHEIEESEGTDTIYDDELAFELDLLSKGTRTKPVFYD